MRHEDFWFIPGNLYSQLLELLNRLFLEFSPKKSFCHQWFFLEFGYKSLQMCFQAFTIFILQSSICFQFVFSFFTRETLIAWKKSWVLIQIQLASGPQENEEVLHPNIFQQILILWHFSLRYFIFSWRFYNAAWIFQNQFRKFWFHILSRATLPYLELSKCQIENRAPSDQNILSHFYWKNISSLLC